MRARLPPCLTPYAGRGRGVCAAGLHLECARDYRPAFSTRTGAGSGMPAVPCPFPRGLPRRIAWLAPCGHAGLS
ncbi:hypothetical protein CFR78_10605 [Komagataeibacter rhaeticus]|nr:hypothetical protein CFR78_10605 [Komagataeibacter rhaeticus]